MADWAAVAGEASIDSAFSPGAERRCRDDGPARRGGQRPRVVGVVGWVDLAAADVADRVAALRAGPNGRFVVGIRHQALAEADPDRWLQQPAVQQGLAAVARAGLPFDLMFRPEHVEAVLRTVRAHPELTFVLDHLGKPPIASGLVEEWARGIRALSKEPNVTCKLSGMLTMAGPDWTVADLRPYVEESSTPSGRHKCSSGRTGRCHCSPPRTPRVSPPSSSCSSRRVRWNGSRSSARRRCGYTTRADAGISFAQTIARSQRITVSRTSGNLRCA